MRLVRISVGTVSMLAELNESRTAGRIHDALPLVSRARIWGEEVYFSASLALPEEEPVAHVPPGTVAYWLPGKAICLFYGQKPASPVEVIGFLRGNPRELANVREGDAVTMEVAEEPPGVPGGPEDFGPGDEEDV